MTIRSNVDLRAANTELTHAIDGLDALPDHVLPKARTAVAIVGRAADAILRECAQDGIAACNFSQAALAAENTEAVRS